MNILTKRVIYVWGLWPALKSKMVDLPNKKFFLAMEMSLIESENF